jgi:hypothetical protein
MKAAQGGEWVWLNLAQAYRLVPATVFDACCGYLDVH